MEEGVVILPREEPVPYNEVITYQCANGYRMTNRPSNSITAICLKNEEFSRELPQCIGNL